MTKTKYTGSLDGFYPVPGYDGFLIHRKGQVINQVGNLVGLTIDKQISISERKHPELTESVANTSKRGTKRKSPVDNSTTEQQTKKRKTKYAIKLDYYRDGVKSQVRLQYLLALTFLPPPPSTAYDEVLFVDGDHTNFAVENLAWSASHIMCDMLDRKFLPTQAFREKLIGMHTGDGWITLSRQKRLQTSGLIPLIPVIGFTQVQDSEVPPILKCIQKVIGGGLYSQEVKDEESTEHRQRHTLQVQDKHICKIVLEWIAEHGNLKKYQAQHVLELMQSRPSMRFTPDEAEEQRAIMTHMHSQDYYHTVDIDDNTITVPFISWFFDAEGCVSMDDDYTVSLILVQRSSPKLANAVARLYGGNNSFDHAGNGERTTWTARDRVINMLTLMQPFSIVKRSQIDLALEALQRTCTRERKREIKTLLRQQKKL